MHIIVPAAGLSSRFPTLEPKFLLEDSNGHIMLYRSVQPYLKKYKVTVGILQAHEEKFNVSKILQKKDDNINIVFLPNLTRGPAETVFEIIKRSRIEDEILVKDCDNFFNSNYEQGNLVYISQLQKHSNLREKEYSYLRTNKNNQVEKIVEKEIISDYFCVGGYKFESSLKYCYYFENFVSNGAEIYLSHIIQYMIYQGEYFKTSMVRNFLDFGTYDIWLKNRTLTEIF